MRLSKRKLHIFPFHVGEIETENRKTKKENGKGKKTYKNSAFKVVIQKCEKSNNGFLAKLPDTICVRKGKKKRIFVRTICFGQTIFWAQNSANQEPL